MRGLSGGLSLVLESTDDGFTAESVLQARGLARLFLRGAIEEHVDFRVWHGRLRPTHYESRDSLSEDDQRTMIDFDWSALRAEESIGGSSQSYPLRPDSVDRLSLQFALMLALGQGRRDERLTLLDGEEKSLQLVYEDTRLRVPLGVFDAVKVRHQRDGSSRATVLWCARDLGYLPVRIEQYRRGRSHVKAELVRLRRL